MVFVDAAHEDAGTIPGMPHRERPPIPRSVILGISMVLGRLGMMRFMASDAFSRSDLLGLSETVPHMWWRLAILLAVTVVLLAWQIYRLP
jgi:hypothetical protein